MMMMREQRTRGSWFRSYLFTPTQAPSLNTNVSQPMDSDPILSGEAISSGSQKNSMNLFIAKPQYFDKCIKISIFVCKYNDF